MRILAVLILCIISFLAQAQGECDPDSSLNPPQIITGTNLLEAYQNRIYQGIPGIERASSGRLWALWYGGGEGEGIYNYVMLATSADNGNTWSNLKVVIDPDGAGKVRAFDPCIWHDPLGRLWVFWSQSYEWFDGRAGVWAMVTENSGDENPVWSQPRRIANGIMMNKPVVLSDGDWLLPCAIWDCSAIGAYPELNNERFSNVYVSRDNGLTFSLRGHADVPDRHYDEHMIVELNDGRLWMLVRTSYGIGQSFSSDKGYTWTAGTASSIANPTARFFIRRLSSGNLLLIKNGPIDVRTSRIDMTAYLSADDGQSWQGGLLLDERSGVAYPDAVEADNGVIYAIYDRNRTTDKEILMAVFTEEDILAGTGVSDEFRTKVIVNKPQEPNAVILPLPGSGTSESPYEIRTEEDLLLINRNLSAHFILMNNIVLSGTVYSASLIAPAGGTDFTGELNGNNFAIENLMIATSCNENLGLFGSIGTDGYVENLILKNVHITGSGNYIGGLAGQNHGYIINCDVTGTVEGYESVGGLAGELSDGGIIVDSSAAVSVTAEYRRVGGLVGNGENGMMVYNSYAAGNVSGVTYVGGLVGRHVTYCHTINCYAKGNVTGSGTYTGGLIGVNGGSDCNVENSYASGEVTGAAETGGLIGRSEHDVINCYATGDIVGTSRVGGLLGFCQYSTSINTNCYSTGYVSGTSYVGGLIGNKTSVVTVNNCYWDKNTSGLLISSGGTAKTTAQMKTQSTFTGWDFNNNWIIRGGVSYPRLRWQLFSAADINLDGIIDTVDISLLAADWLKSGTGMWADIHNDNIINFLDFEKIASQWMYK